MEADLLRRFLPRAAADGEFEVVESAFTDIERIAAVRRSAPDAGITMTKCGLPVETATLDRVPSANSTVRSSMSGIPMPVVIMRLDRRSRSSGIPGCVQTRMPASVSMRVRRRPLRRFLAIHAATQRVPLPLISAMEPSALCRRMRPDWSPVQAKNSTPSAPTPVLRAQSARVSSAQSCRLRPLR